MRKRVWWPMAALAVAGCTASQTAKHGGSEPVGAGDSDRRHVTPAIPEWREPVTCRLFQGVLQNKRLEQRDARVVWVKTKFPLGALRDAIERGDPKYKPLPTNFRTILITDVEWQRQYRRPNGTWSEWEKVPALQGDGQVAVDPLVAETSRIVSDFAKIPSGNGPGQTGTLLREKLMAGMGMILQPPLPEQFAPPGGMPMFAVAAPTWSPGTDPRAGHLAPPVNTREPAVQVTGGAGETASGGVVPPSMPPPLSPFAAPPLLEGMPHVPGSHNLLAPGVPPLLPANVGTVDYGALTAEENVAIWAYDDSVVSDREYRYRVRLKVYNPLYRWPTKNLDLLVEPKAARTPWLVTRWAESDKSVRCDPEEYLFFTHYGNGLAAGAKENIVSVEIYKYKLGQWHMGAQRDLHIGEQVGVASRSSPVIVPGMDMVARDFATGCTIVDINPSDTDGARIVLLDSSGQLVTRTIAEDSGAGKRTELQREAYRVRRPPRGPEPPRWEIPGI